MRRDEPTLNERGAESSGVARTLADARVGEALMVSEVRDPVARLTALRFGMAEGARISCVARVPAGPIILKSGRQEIAVGRRLAGRIGVTRLEEPC